MTKHANKMVLTTLALWVLQMPLLAGNMGLPDISDYDERAYQYGVHLTIPNFPGTVADIEAATEIITGNMTEAGDRIAGLEAETLTFENTFRALDWITHRAYSDVLPINITKNTSTDPALREAASKAVLRFEEAEIEFNYREDIYEKLRAFAETDPILPEVDRRLMEQILKEYRRLGYDLPAEEREEVEALQKKLTHLSTEFRDNIRESNESLFFTAEELEGMTASFLKTIETEDGRYEIKPNVTHHVVNVYKTAKNEEVRRRVYVARANRARSSNIPVLQEMVITRNQLANKLGYETWADYRLEDRMAGKGDRAVEFLKDLVDRLEPKFQAEFASLEALKREDTDNPDAELKIWDVTYYEEQQNQKLYDLDNEKLKQFFPYDKCVEGLFHIYETVFGIEITEIDNPTAWHPSVSLYAVSDAESEKPLGLFYIDPFPREGKYNHFAKFSIIGGTELPDGTYQRPTVALICNFPPPEDNQPSLLAFSQVQTLFHEFGHCMHSILTESKYSRFSGTSVPRDFVETPSQVMEYWLQQKSVLDLFAADWKDQSVKLPATWIEKIIESEKAQAGMFYRRQLALGLMDMALHHQNEVESIAANLVDVSNQIAEEVSLPYPEDTAFIAAFGHMAGYDAGYYGYAWADVIAADFAQRFMESEKGFMDTELGMRLRREVFEKGNSRDVNESVRAFLGREPEMAAFIQSLGIAGEDDQTSTPKSEEG